MIETKTTLFQPMLIGLRAMGRSNYRSIAVVGSRINWSPMAAKLDWSSIDDLDEFRVRVRYAETLETCKKSKHKAYSSLRDFRRLPGGRRFGRTICKVKCGHGNHIVRISNNGSLSERTISATRVIMTVRLFLSVQFVQRGLDIRIDEFEQLGGYTVKNAACLTIRPAES
jgi:hypothetical protein